MLRSASRSRVVSAVSWGVFGGLDKLAHLGRGIACPEDLEGFDLRRPTPKFARIIG